MAFLKRIRIDTITVVLGILAWACFGVFIVCSSGEVFYKDHSSPEFIVGSKAIELAGILSIVSTLLATYGFFRYKFTKKTVLSAVLAYSLFGFFAFILGLAIITGGA